MMRIPSVQECMATYIRYGECHHYHIEKVKPYGCKVEIDTCQICKKEFGRRYL